MRAWRRTSVKKSPAVASGALSSRNYFLQSGKPAASGGFVALLEEGEPVVVELVPVPLVVLPLVVLPLVVLPLVVVPLLLVVPGVSLRTCFVTLSQHFMAPGDVALGEVVVVEVWATAIPTLPARTAAAMSPIPVVRMRLYPSGWGDEPRRVTAVT